MSSSTETQIRNIRDPGRYARRLKILGGVVLLIIGLWSLWAIAAGPVWSGWEASLGQLVAGDHVTAVQVKVWLALVVGAVSLIILAWYSGRPEVIAMNSSTEAQIRNIRKTGRYARPFCVLTGVMLVIVGLWSLWSIAAAPTWGGWKVSFGPYVVAADHMTTPQVKAWSILVVGAVFAILLGGLFHLYRLFGNLALGTVYTADNVRHIRRVGLYALAMAVLQLLVPVVSFALLEIGFIDRTLVTMAAEGTRATLAFGPASLGAFILPVLILLSSWIMEVGRQTRVEADTLRREAELVI